MSLSDESVEDLVSQAHSLRVLKARRDFPFYCDFVHYLSTSIIRAIVKPTRMTAQKIPMQ